jgi:alkylation response protein AidB-like acyl-CoA dehydrogenase
MYFKFSDDQEQLRATVRRFLADRAPLSYVRDMYETSTGTTPELWGGLVDLGVTGVLVPEAHGGLGLGLVDIGVVIEELGRAVHPGPFLSSVLTATAAILAAGDPEDHVTYLPALASGERIATLAIFEPAQRYRWMEPATRAIGASGGSWSVSGTKVHVHDAAAADLLLVTAAIDAETLGLFAVEAGTATVQPEEVLDGSRKQATVILDGAPARRIGSADVTGDIAGVIDRTLVGLVLDAVGAAGAALELTVRYVNGRMQFDRPIGAFQHVQRHCVDAFEQIEMSRTAAYYAMWACDDGDAVEAHRAAVMAKAFASDALPAACAATVQAHGGIGVTWEYDLHLYYKRCLSMQSAFGGAAEHYEDVASIITGEPAGARA